MARAPAGALGRGLSISREVCWQRRCALGLLTILLIPFAGTALAQLRTEVTPAQGAGASSPAPNRTGASGWVVTPSLRLAQTYTDNVFLAPADSRQSDWTTQIIPGISVTSNGPRLRLDASYAPEIVYHARKEGEDDVFHRGNAVSILELADKLLFLEAGAKVDQYDISLRGPLTTSNVNITGNRATAATAYVSPYLRRNIGSTARAEARFTYSTWKSDEDQPALPDNTARRINLQLANGPAYRLLTWNIAYAGDSIRYDTHLETTSEVVTAGARRSITSTVGVLVQAGYERYDTGLPEVLEDPRYGAGFDWTPTPRTRLAAMAGQRLGDETYSFEFRHRTRLTNWSVRYAEDVTTSREQFFVPATQSTAGVLDQVFLSQYPDPVARQKAVQEFIARTGLPPSLGAPVNFFTDQLFLQKRWLASVGLHGVRNTLVATGFSELRELAGGTAPPVGDFAASESVRTSGGSLAWALRLGARNTWNLQAGYSRSEFLDSGQVDDFVSLQAGVSRQLQPRVSGSLSYRLQNKDSTQAGAEYRENAGIASLLVTF
jgi:uncharacterized protein (PEP-CTERM system associated)